MKKLIISALFLLVANLALGQYYYKSNYANTHKVATFQVAPTVSDYDGLKFGFGIGVNIKQVFSFNYFHTRDYGVNEETPYLDNRFAGFHASLAQPVADNIELAIGARKGALNNEMQKTLLTGEVRYKFNDSWRLAFEYGGNKDRNMASMRLLFNLY